jgi:hypothetical protein
MASAFWIRINLPQFLQGRIELRPPKDVKIKMKEWIKLTFGA